MPIEPPSCHPTEISVAEPLTPAYERVKEMLFKPFDLGKWVVIGFGAWLAGLGESGGGFPGGFGGNSGNNFNANGNGADQLRHLYHQVSDYIAGNLIWIVPAAAALFVLLLVFGTLLLWLNCHGKFMFLHCVALNRAEVTEPWEKFNQPANSLFWFRLVLWLISLVVTLPMIGLLVLMVIKITFWNQANFGNVMTAVTIGATLLGISLIFMLVRKFLMDFVVPIMFLRQGSCLAAWREFLSLLGAHPGQFALYILFQIVLAMVISVLVMMAILITCCIAACVLALPFIGTVLLLPVLIFKRSYSLYYLAQFGPEYDVFPKPVVPVPASAPPMI